MNKMEFLINNYQDRRTMAGILAEAGYMITIEERKAKGTWYDKMNYFLIVFCKDEKIEE